MIEPRLALTWLSGKELARVRTRAIRRGDWYRTLSKTERALLDLTIRVVKKTIRSFVLSRILASIIEKLQIRAEHNIAALFHKIGQPLTEKISKIARKWGNTSADSWMADDNFAQFLAIMHVNDPLSFIEEGSDS